MSRARAYQPDWVSQWLRDGARGAEALRGVLHADVVWHAPHPINTLRGAAAVFETFWRPLLAALPDLERRDDIRFRGHGACEDWVCATGTYAGTFRADWLGIPATGGLVHIRFGEFSHVVDGAVVEACTFLDLPSLMWQAGVLPFRTGVGANPWVPAPRTHDGIVTGTPALAESARTLQLVGDMLDGLMRYDPARRDLGTMEQHRFWSDDMMWYGPVGIGSTRGLSGFQKFHQVPFLHGFPDRVGGHHKARMARGLYAASTGWPSIHATHTGEYLGVPATGRKIEMRVMDLWRREGERLAENWVFIDLPHLLLQIGYDVFAEMSARASNKVHS